MLAGDDELDAILAEMGGGGGSSSSRQSSNKAKVNEPPPPPLDFRLARNPTTEDWPNCLVLEEGFAKDTSCKKWKDSKEKMDVCQSCGKSRACHRLVVRHAEKQKEQQQKHGKKKQKMKPKILLPWLFCHTRNIRCVASEISQDQQHSSNLHNQMEKWMESISL